MSLSRRSLLAGTALAACAPRLVRAAGEQKTLHLQTRQIEVGGKAATRYGVVQASGAFGLTLNEGDDLDVRPCSRRPARPAKIANDGSEATSAVGLAEELQLRASEPLPVRPIDNSVPVDLIGDMAAYVWGMQVDGMGGAPVTVKRSERVELVMRNVTMMSHPMHLHGHNFQVTEINSQKLSGAVRDTVLVPPMTTVKVVFDADNPGLWAYHCHNLYHMEAGMFSTVVYEGFS